MSEAASSVAASMIAAIAIRPAVRDLRVLVLAGVQFCFTLGSYGIGIWLPQIVKAYKFSNLEVSLIVAVPYLFASVAMIAWA